MNTDRMQTQRFELKYQVPEAVALAARTFVRPRLEPDSFGGTPDAPSYPVHSVYIDSDGLSLFQATINGDRNRFKLRVRYYDDNPNTPVYLEIKRRVDRCIHKQRALVRRECVAALLDGEPPSFHNLAQPDVRRFAALQRFCELTRRLGARPCAHVGYDREAWLSPGSDSVRVTMDRQILCEPMRLPILRTSFTRPAKVFERMVVLEIKFTNRFPSWLRDMVQTLGLVQASAAKYVDGVVCCGETQFRSAGNVLFPVGESRSRRTSRASVWSADTAIVSPFPV